MTQHCDMAWTGVGIITGASSGIGAAVAQKLSKSAKGLIIAARREDQLQEIASQCGKHVIPVRCDVTKSDDVMRLAEYSLSEFGSVDAIVNNAGVLPMASMTRCHLDDWHHAVDVNVKGVLNGIAAVLPHMLEQGAGHIINISSTAGRRIFAGAAVYCGTKHAVRVISEGLQLDLSERSVKDGNTIKVTSIMPGLVKTELPSSVTHEQSRVQFQSAMDNYEHPLLPHDIAESVAFALSTPSHVELGEIAVRPTTQNF